MNTSHFQFWPARVTKTLTVPETTLYDNLLVSARRYPQKEAIYYYGGRLTYEEILSEVNALAGFLQVKLGVAKGERVLLYMQNSPQFLLAYFAILRAEAIVVPINPMNTAEELSFFIKDGGIAYGIVGQELLDRVAPLRAETPLRQLVVAAYSDYIGEGGERNGMPPEVQAPRKAIVEEGIYLWKEALDGDDQPRTYEGKGDDIALLPYTSGTTGLPKGCIHTHKTVQANAVSANHWMNVTVDAVHLVTLPLFHVTGMLHSMIAPIYSGGSMVMMTRWNRDHAGQLIAEQQCTHWVNISTMLIDFLANPQLADYDISSLTSIAGGGAPLPAAIGEKLYQLTGLKYVEGYGLSETISHTHFNPPDRPKLQCLGVPSFGVDARIIDPVSLQELGVGQEGEIVVNGPQVFKGYYNRPEENEQSFIMMDGKTFFRTGDIGRVDDEGYFFIVDRVKRMINASGFKVWPTEVESILYKHPAVQQACVVGIPDVRRGETVKAYIILHEEYKGKVTEQELIDWSKEQMAAYKYPRVIQFRDSLPMTTSGKIMWRILQEEEKEGHG